MPPPPRRLLMPLLLLLLLLLPAPPPGDPGAGLMLMAPAEGVVSADGSSASGVPMCTPP
jgi:hypothetical protein